MLRLGHSYLRHVPGKLVSFLVAAVVLLAHPSAPAGQVPTNHAEQTQNIFKTLRTGDWQHALSMLETYNLQFPHDPQMLYNQACLENRAGKSAAALATLQKALAAGFDEMGFALQDPDLKGVANSSQLFDLDTTTQTQLLTFSKERQISLEFGKWSDPVVLTTPDSLGSGPTIRLAWQPVGLRIEITTPMPWDDYTASGIPPWLGGAGAILNLVIPDSTETFAGGNTFSFAFGAEKGGPTAAQFLPGPGRWQRVAEMDPKLTSNQAGQSILTATIPWPAIMPFHPLVDPVLGINLQVRRDSAHGYAKAVLMPDPWAWAPLSAALRYVPLTFRLDTVTTDLFMGRLSDSISGQKPLELSMTAICPQGGPARLTFNFLDPATHSVLPGGPRSESVNLQAGVNTLTRQADFQGLQSGAYLIRTGLRFPSGKEAAWSTTVLQLTKGWREDLDNRIDKLPASEQPTLRRMLAAIVSALSVHHQRRSPNPIATTLQDMQTMLNQATATGSILPDFGPVTLVYPGPTGEQHLCTLYLAADTDSTTGVEPVLVLPPVSGHEGFLIDRIARNHEHGNLQPQPGFTRRPIYIVPHQLWAQHQEAQAEQEASSCLSWALAYLGGHQAAVVGVGAGAGPALRLATLEPQLIDRVLVFAAKDLDPWPGLEEKALAAKLKPAPAIPITWVDFPMETDQGGQGPEILAQLRKTGWTIADFRSVLGGLSLSQAADRMVLWVTGHHTPEAE